MLLSFRYAAAILAYLQHDLMLETSVLLEKYSERESIAKLVVWHISKAFFPFTVPATARISILYRITSCVILLPFRYNLPLIFFLVYLGS